MFESYSLSDTGRVREVNEDSIAVNSDMRLWVLADGVGGHSHGDVASQMVVQSVEREVRQGRGLSEAIQAAHQVILESVRSDPTLAGMASTVIACHMHSDQYEIAWVGDSRAYLLNRQGIFRLTKDHNRAQMLLDSGELNEEEAWNHPSQFELTQALGLGEEPEVALTRGVIEEGEYLLLCSDGLSGELTDLEIYSYLDEEKSCEQITEQLRDAANEHGGSDNISIVLIRACAPRLGKTPVRQNQVAEDAEPQKIEDRITEQPTHSWQLPRTMVLLVILMSAFILYLLG